MELPKPGAEVTKGKAFGTVESVKAVSELFAPASGSVTAVNDELANTPEKINEDAHSAWMIKIKLKNLGEVNSLIAATAYDKYLTEEAGS